MGNLATSIINGSTLIDVSSDRRFSDVVEALTWCPLKTKCSANGSPSQPLPNMLIVSIITPIHDKINKHYLGSGSGCSPLTKPGIPDSNRHENITICFIALS